MKMLRSALVSLAVILALYLSAVTPALASPPAYVIPGKILYDVTVCYPVFPWGGGAMRRVRMGFFQQFRFWDWKGSTIYYPWYVAPRTCPRRPGSPVLHIGRLPPKPWVVVR